MTSPQLISTVSPIPRAHSRSALPSSAAALPLTGAAFVVREIERRGIEVIVGIPGGAILPLYDALQASRVRHVLARHEQGAGFIAQGMARATGKAAVCLATSGPGVTNLITALADARADSVPLVAITAQVPRALIGTDAFQEVDTVALARPVTKQAFFADSIEALVRLLPQAFELAEGGRPGPVLIDIPKDVFKEHVVLGDDIRGRGPSANSERPPVSGLRRPAQVARWLDAEREASWRELAAAIEHSQRPLLYIGGGIHMSGVRGALFELACRADIPVVSSLHGLGSFPGDDPRFLGMLGMHGAPYTNHATEEADLVLAIGVRFDDRATGDPAKFCRNARIVHIDIDAREIGKIKPVAWGVLCDAGRALSALLEHVTPTAHETWRQRIEELRAQHPLSLSGEACGVLNHLGALLGPDTIVTTDVGQHQMWTVQCLRFQQPRTLLTSGGLGTMGFGLPAAIGAALARPEARVVCVSGDGSIAMNLQELATLAELGSNVLVLVLNNGQLGLVRQQQQLFYGQRFSASHFEQATDFAAVARAFGIRAHAVDAANVTRERLRAWLAEAGPCL
ncbi:MAG TPA: biosynthetic-type acetolactate synthase large subunit, partial [Polyangiaceae bacterium]|nr:biosynthetic-type acetolactate synthase large subunit [Polyangiaceae bacterium]